MRGRGTGLFYPLWPLSEITGGPLLLEPREYDFGCKGTPCERVTKSRPLCEQWELPMTMRDDHHITDTEDVAFDRTMKIMGVAVVLIVIAGMAVWYLYS